MATKTVEERLAVLEAREAIKETIANYCHGVDKADEALFMEQWEEGAVWDIGAPWGVCRNKEEIRNMIRAIFQGLPETHHWTTNTTIEVNGGEATAVSDVWATATNAKGVPLLISATYWDRLSNRTGKWRFVERKVKIFFMTPVLEPWSDRSETRINPKM